MYSDISELITHQLCDGLQGKEWILTILSRGLYNRMQISVCLGTLHGLELTGDFEFGFDRTDSPLRSIIVRRHALGIEEGQNIILLFIQIVPESCDCFLFFRWIRLYVPRHQLIKFRLELIMQMLAESLLLPALHRFSDQLYHLHRP